MEFTPKMMSAKMLWQMKRPYTFLTLSCAF